MNARMMTPKRALWPASIFIIVFLIHTLSPVAASGDSRWTVMIALSLLDRGDTNLDEYLGLIKKENYYNVECIGSLGNRMGPAIRDCRDGHIYNWYPIGGPLLVTPFVGLIRAALQFVAPLIKRLPIPPVHPVVDAFLAGDPIGGHSVIELIMASFLVAASAVMMFLIGACFLSRRYATMIAFIFAFATSAWSTGSRSMVQHTPSMLMIAITIYILIKAENKPGLVALAGIPVAFAYVIRPTNALLAMVISIYVLARYPRQFLAYLACALPIAAGFFAYSLSNFGAWRSSYYSLRPPLPNSINGARAFLTVLAGNLISPSRGLLIFTPLFTFSIVGMVRATRCPRMRRLSIALIAIVVLHWIVISSYVDFWWAGHSYGPRLFTDLTPIFVFFLIPVLLPWQQAGPWHWSASRALFTVLLAASIFVHARGAWSYKVWFWNQSPVNVDLQPERVWSWRDPQFLRGLH
jgi:hypothetical protein